jgi:hypothetical protein
LNYSGKYPAVVQLRATDGGIQHVITVVDGMIFDSNCERALQLAKDQLDWCCSSDDVESSYDRVEYGYCLFEQPRKDHALQASTRTLSNGAKLFIKVLK